MKKLEQLFANGFQALSSDQTGKIYGGRTFTICTSDTNDPSYECGDTNVKCTDDNGSLYHERTDAKECIYT